MKLKLIFVCYMLLGESFGNEILPLKTVEHVPEGTEVTLSCNYTGGAGSELYWYRQFPGSAPEFAFYILESGMNRGAEPPIPRLTAHIQKNLKRVDLKISTATVSDSAVYYCALRPTVEGKPSKWYKKGRKPSSVEFQFAYSNVVLFLSN